VILALEQLQLIQECSKDETAYARIVTLMEGFQEQLIAEEAVDHSAVMRAWRENRQALRALLDASQNTAILLDPQGLVLATNEAVAHDWGKNLDEVIATNVYDYFDTETARRRKAFIDLVVSSGQPIRFEDERQNRYYVNSIYPIFDEQGQVTQLAIYGTDVTEQRRAQKAEQDQRALTEALLRTTFLLNSTLKLDEVLEYLLANVGEVVPHDFANVLLIDGDTVYIAEHRGAIPSELELSIPLLRLSIRKMHYLQQMTETRQPVIVADVWADPNWTMVLPTDQIYRAYLGSPIILGHDVIGFINLRSREVDFFNPTHAQRLIAFANQAALAIHNAQTHQQARELAALEERQRLARDLHDAVSQTLFSASVIAEILPQTIQKNPEKARQHAQELNQLTKGALAEMRALLVELRPEALLQTHLDELIAQLCTALNGRTRVKVDLQLTGQRNLPPDTHITFYRIAQECLNNIVRHSDATRIRVGLQQEEDQVKLQIEDNGRGFELNRLQTGHLGLKIMQERAQTIGATLTIDSQPEKGTVVTLIWSNGAG